MARRLFEEQAVRTRRGKLATGVEYVVYTDAAATVLADISATSGGSSVAGSTVTTADLDGLGPAAFRFYGPPSGQDTLYLRCPADTSLGVQEIEADTDERLDALETGGGVGAHPDLAVHDALGLATDAELSAHNLDTTSVHGITDTTVLATDAEVTSAVSTHAADTDPHGDRAYADAIAQGLDVKASVRVASTADLTLSGEQTIDGVLTASSRVLVKNQAAGAANGIYVSAAGAWARAVDADTGAEVGPGMFTFVEEGTANGGTGWVQTTPNPITLGTTALAFTQFSTGGTIIGGAGLLKTGNTLDVVAGTGITVDAATVGIAPGGVSNTQIAALAAIAESKLALNFPTHAESHAARHAVAGADPLTGYVQDSAHTLAAHDTLGLVTDAILAAHEADTTVVHGITDTSALATTSGVTAAVSAHQADTTVVHGITDTAQVAIRNAANTFTIDNTFNAGALFASGRPWVDAAAFVQPSDAGDDALALQRAIDFAQTLVGSSTKTPMVVLTGDEYHWSTPVTAKSAPIVSLTTLNNGCRVYWDGAAGATVITKSAVHAGSLSFWELSGIAFAQGTAEPATWLDLTADNVDFGFRLHECSFAGSTSDAIKTIAYINCHWEHLRFDNIGGYAIRLTPDSSQSLSSFVLDGFTYDHNRASGPGSGVLMVDNTANASNLGVFALKNGRVEINTALAGNKAVVALKLTSPANARTVGVYLENITYQDAGGTSGDVLLYQETAATNLFPSLMLVNVRQVGLTAIVGGSLSTSFPAIPVQANYSFVAVSGGGNEVVAGALRVLLPTGGTPLAVRKANEANDRVSMDENGVITWGPGTGAGDTNLKRLGTDYLGTDDNFYVAQFFEMQEQASDPAAPAANKVRFYPKDVGGKTALFARFPTGAVQQIAIEP